MKWISNIFSFLLIWLICNANGCNDGENIAERREESQISIMKDSVRAVFEAGTPGDNLLKAYEETAKQRLIDFADYLKIVSDSSVNNVFRAQAAEMARKIFISGSTDITDWNRYTSASGRITVDSLLSNSLSNRIATYIQPVQISIQKSLKIKNDTLYEGNLSFYPQRNFFEKNDFSETGKEMLVIDIYAVRKLKSFGKENLSLWEVCLGDIKIALKQE
jgi:hypothetical protein